MLENIDKGAFFYINQFFNHPILDRLMIILSDIGNGSVFFILAFILLFSRKRELKLLGMALLAGLTVSYYVVSGLKALIARPRPFMTLQDIRLLAQAKSMSFPSAHASMSFMMATVLTAYFKRYASFFYALAAAIAISRVYIGVHYPSDILAGAVLGVVIALLLIQAQYAILKTQDEKRPRRPNG